MIEAIVGLVAVFLELVIHLVSLTLTSAYMATRTKGLAQAAYVGALLSGLYLVMALLRGFMPDLASPSISAFFSWPLATIAVVALMVFWTIPFAISIAKRRQLTLIETAPKAKPDLDAVLVPTIVIYTLSFSIVMGGLAIWSETSRSPRMESRYCERLLERFDPELTVRAKMGLELLGEFVEKDFNKFSCLKREAPAANINPTP